MKIALNSLVIDQDQDLTKLIILEPKVIELFNSNEERVDFLQNIILPWFISLVPSYDADEFFQQKTLLSFLFELAPLIPPSVLFNTIKDILKNFFQMIKKIKSEEKDKSKNEREGKSQSYDRVQNLIDIPNRKLIQLITSEIKSKVIVLQKSEFSKQVDINL